MISTDHEDLIDCGLGRNLEVLLGCQFSLMEDLDLKQHRSQPKCCFESLSPPHPSPPYILPSWLSLEFLSSEAHLAFASFSAGA